ncbi:hypothetical protein [Bradyrhizobium sp. SSUT77]|uniref:hypothetical protein n=1 Tax=Bradyrhizobium sp. SSUT77 TaxID=3040603 RepID=UPI00244C786E|nr:hypothetical protein [Bradyrhizobium sp. SSUT77]MDH2344804.1 hypothetical protein [Bradyrhizobium sp. SSUT77]
MEFRIHGIPPVAMDDKAPENQVRLCSGLSRPERLLGAGMGIALVLFGRAELAIVTFLLIAIGLVIIYKAAFSIDECWSITRNRIFIGRAHPFGRLQTKVIERNDIAEMQVRSDRGRPERFAVSLKLASGDQLTSPPIAEITRVNEISCRIAELLGTPRSIPPANPLDAVNAEIRIGEPVRQFPRTEARIVILVIASLCAMIYAHRLWKDLSLSLPEMILLPIGFAVAFVVFRYAHRFADTSWIVRHGELRIERLSSDGKLSIDTITGRDVESIAIKRPDDGNYLVVVELRNGKKIYSAEIGTETETRAVSDEIVRRLGIVRERVRR